MLWDYPRYWYSTSKQMQLFSEFLRENKMDIPVLCGGAAINSDYINRIAKGDGNIYNAGIFYCKTAFEGLKVMNNLMTGSKEEYMNKWLEKLSSWKERKYDEATKTQDLSNILSSVKPVKDKPVPPKFNFVTRLENKDLPLKEIWQYLNKKSLFVLSWGLRGKKATELKDEYEELLKEWKVKVVKENLLDPHAVYSYFRCRKVGNNNLSVKYQDDNKIDSELTFEFPRSSNSSHLCLADYFDSESDDVVAFQSVTMGNKVTQIIDEWNKQGRYTDAYYLHGLAVETTEALADWVNYKIKEELRLKEGGLRYSWGYPSCPDITQHFMVWKLLNPSISGMTLTESGQIDPEFSTAAMSCDTTRLPNTLLYRRLSNFPLTLLYYNGFCFLMGKVEKGITCSVLGCEESADRSMSLAKAKMSQDLDFDNSKKRVYLCRNHYKDWKKSSKEDRENERLRWN